jgi:ABC-2 type transport system ATP-binding protein
VLFLDEPTIGLDLVGQNNIRNFLLEFQETYNTTIVLTSHYMADVEALCKRIVLILDGKKAFDGTRASFEGILGKEKFVSFRFDKAPERQHQVWQSLDPKWNTDGLKVDVRIPEKRLRELSSQILNTFEVVDFYTEKLPIERVMASLITKHGLAAKKEMSHDRPL